MVEDPLNNLRSQALPSPSERRLVRDALTQLLYLTLQLFCHIVVGVLVEEHKRECGVDHEPGRQRSRPTVPFATLRQDLAHQLGRHPLRDQAQPYSLR